MKPKPIETAPKDGTVILSDCGFVRYVDQRNWGSPVENGWHECTPSGWLYEQDDEPLIATPQLWVPVPEWIG